MPNLVYIRIFIIASTSFFLAFFLIEHTYWRASTRVNKIWYYVGAMIFLLLVILLSTHFVIA